MEYYVRWGWCISISSLNYRKDYTHICETECIIRLCVQIVFVK